MENENRETLAEKKRFAMVRNSKTFANIVKTFDLGNKEVLDIGCSYGEHLVHFGEGSLGITITKAEVEYGKERGYNIMYGNIEFDSFALDRKFDVIYANNIFEHLYSPHHFLIKIKKYLKEDGILILGVPCVPKVQTLVKFPKFRGSLACAHLNFFTKFTLRKTAERGGWSVKDIRGFRIRNRFIDHLLDYIYPHFYVVATADETFEYTPKRMVELAGYMDVSGSITFNDLKNT